MKKADARVWIATPELVSALRPALESVIQSRLTPDDILRQARAGVAQIKQRNAVQYPSLLLSIYLAPFLGQTNADKTFRAQLWQCDQQLSELITEGGLSSLIWQSFLALPTAQQNQLSTTNRSLRLYSQLFDVLKKPTEHLDLLTDLVTEDSTFVRQQLEHDAELRQQYLFALGHCKKSKFKTLTELVVQTPVFAEEFVELLTHLIERKTDNISSEHAELYRTLSLSILKDRTIADALLKNSALCKRNPQLVAQLLISPEGGLAEYKAKFESASWLLLNGLKGILTVILPFLLRFMDPPINSEILDVIEGTAPNFKPKINPNQWKPRTNGFTNGDFNNFRRAAAVHRAANLDSVVFNTTLPPKSQPAQIPPGTPMRLPSDNSFLASPITANGQHTENTLDLTFEPGV